MTNENREKIAKVYELVERGATEGEKKAAEAALKKLLKKFNLSEDYLNEIKLKKYEFKYATNLDLMLFNQLHHYFFPNYYFKARRNTFGKKVIVMSYEYLDYVVMQTAYEYFKSHMSKQFKSHCMPLINRCRTTKTKNKRRDELQKLFFSQYIFKSKIYHADQVAKIDLSKLSEKELNDRMKLMNIEGGQYNVALNNGLMLNQ
jgi:hypothetical protein